MLSCHASANSPHRAKMQICCPTAIFEQTFSRQNLPGIKCLAKAVICVISQHKYWTACNQKNCFACIPKILRVQWWDFCVARWRVCAGGVGLKAMQQNDAVITNTSCTTAAEFKSIILFANQQLFQPKKHIRFCWPLTSFFCYLSSFSLRIFSFALDYFWFVACLWELCYVLGN